YQKDHPCSLFISNNQNYRTCNMCRNQDKKNYISKKHTKEFDNEIIIDFHDLYDHIMEFIEPFEGEKTVKDQENQKSLKFEFFCTVNISMLEGDSKE
ncbi:27359_t:CDS:1, partial [Gigaspora margarita]